MFISHLGPGSIAQSVALLTADHGRCVFESQPSLITFVETDHEIDHEIISTIILPIRDGQFPVTGESMCKVLVNPLEV